MPDCEATYIVDVIAARGWLRVPCATTDRKKAKKRHLTEGMTEETLTDLTVLIIMAFLLANAKNMGLGKLFFLEA